MARLSSFYRKAIGRTQCGFASGRGLIAGRTLPMWLLWLSAILLISQSGCSVWDLARRTMRDEPDCYDVRPEEEEDLERYRCWAVEAWQSVTGNMGSGPFYDGFVDGFVDNVYSGGSGEPPVIPPCQFWTDKNGDTSTSIAEWNAGFRRGAAAAKDGGYRARVVVPITIGPGGPQRANVSGQCVAREPSRSEDHQTDDSPWDMSATDSDPVEFMEAPETGYEIQNTTEAPDTSEARGELPVREEPVDAYEDSTPWTDPRNQTIELDPAEQYRNESVGPTLGNPGGLRTPPDAPTESNNADEMLDSLLPENLEPPQSNPGESDSIDLDDLFSASTGQQSSERQALHNQGAARAQQAKAKTERGEIPTAYNGYKDWSYGDIVAASQSEQTSTMPAVVASGGKWPAQKSHQEDHGKPQVEDKSTANTGLIQFAQDFESHQSPRQKVRQATITKPVELEKGAMTPLRNWRISDWQKKFSNGDQGPGSDEREGVSFDAWERAYGTKK